MRMRALILAAAIAACSASPALSPRDCTPGTTVACACPGASGVQTCSAEGALGACVCADAAVALDATQAADVVDAPAPIDVVSRDVVSGADAQAADAPRAADVVDAGRCPNGTRAVCDGRSVSLQSGEQDGGLRHHCGACGNTCAAGEFCVQCVCTR